MICGRHGGSVYGARRARGADFRPGGHPLTHAALTSDGARFPHSKMTTGGSPGCLRDIGATTIGHMPPTPAHAPRRRRADETSAGGLVIRTKNGVPAGALIGRLDRRGRLRWSLPKGHVEAGETTEQAAVREVAEETGISGRITARLGSVEYTFTAEGKRIHKRVHHFLMEAVAGELSDADVEVTEVAWVPMDQMPVRLAYAGERRLAERAAQLLADSA